MTRVLHRYCLFLSMATFCLLTAGALVTSHDAGLSAPDWPLSYGQVFPKMVGNLFWEHGHRLVATTVGTLTIGLVLYLYRYPLWRFLQRVTGLRARGSVTADEPPLWLRRLGLIALGAVITQGLLGGLTVKLLLPWWVSTAHATLAQLFFCTVVSLAVLTSPRWSKEAGTPQIRPSTRLHYLELLAVGTIFLQLVLGATLRHSATWDQELPRELVLAHIGGAFVVTVAVTTVAITTLRQRAAEPYLTRPAWLLLMLLGAQLVLGLGSYLTRVNSPNDPQPLPPMIGVTVAHVACGALVFATCIVLTFRSLLLESREECTDLPRAFSELCGKELEGTPS